MSNPSKLRLLIERLVAQPGGLAMTEVPGRTPREVSRVMLRLVASGQVFRGRLSQRLVRFFGSEEDAARWIATPPPAVEVDPTHAPWSDSTPANYPTNVDGSPAWTFTRCPPSMLGVNRTNTHDDRW